MSQEFRMAFGDDIERRLHDASGKKIEGPQAFYLDAEWLLGPKAETEGARLECQVEADGKGLVARPERGMEIAMLPGEWAAAFFEALERVERGVVAGTDVTGKRSFRVAKAGEIREEKTFAERKWAGEGNGERKGYQGKGGNGNGNGSWRDSKEGRKPGDGKPEGSRKEYKGRGERRPGQGAPR